MANNPSEFFVNVESESKRGCTISGGFLSVSRVLCKWSSVLDMKCKEGVVTIAKGEIDDTDRCQPDACVLDR